jgi:hypothetical protein
MVGRPIRADAFRKQVSRARLLFSQALVSAQKAAGAPAATAS